MAGSAWRGPATMIGGALIHLCLGSFYCWGNFMSYAPTSLKFFDGKEHPGSHPDALLVLPALIVSMTLFMPHGPSIVAKIGTRNTLFLGSAILVLGSYLSSYAKTLAHFMFFYSFIFGVGTGLVYTAPMAAGWKWKPQSKGLVSGVILTGFGAGGFVYNIIGTMLANPKGLNQGADGRFPAEVYAAFPHMLRTLATIYAAVCFVGALLVSVPAESQSQTQTQTQTTGGVTLQQAIRTPQFWLLWGMVVTCASAGLNVASGYKTFAASAPALIGDNYQVLVGSLAALVNGVGRLFWGTFSDVVGFRNAFLMLSVGQTALLALYPVTTVSKPVFMAATTAIFFCLGGNFALMPPAVGRLFGAKHSATIYGVLYSSFGVAAVGGAALSKVLTKSLGYQGTFLVMAGFSLVAAALSTQLSARKDLFAESSI